MLGVILVLHVRLLRQPWGLPPAGAVQAEAELASLQRELATAYAQQQQMTERIQTMEQRLAALSPVEPTEKKEP